MATLKEKIESFLKLGGDKETAERIMQEAEALEASAKAAGIAAKAVGGAPASETPAPAAKEETPAAIVPPAPTAEDIAKQAAQLVLAQLAPVLDGLKAQAESAGTATKEAGDRLAAQLAQVSTAQATLAKRIDDLDSLQPRAFRASQAESTIAGAGSTVKDAKPGPDAKGSEFLSFVMGQAPTAK